MACSGGCGCGGKCSDPINKKKRVPMRYDFEGSSTLGAWGVIGADDVGGVRFRDLDICDTVLRVSANLIDGSGFAVETTAQLAVFFLRRQEDRQIWEDNAFGPVLWRALLNGGTRSFMAGINYGSTIPRELTATNFGHGWQVPSDWRKVAGRDRADPPVLYVLWRSITGGGANFSSSLVYEKGDCL